MFRSDINYPKVSVVVPFYNSSETIDETLCSVEAQTYPSVEIIVVNDGSNEYHSNKLKQILSNRPHVQLVEQPNKGPASARNLGARQASGVYFCFLDSDDVIKPQYLSACAEVLKDPKIKLVYTKAEFFGAREGDWSLPPYEGLKSILLGNRIPNAVALQRSKDFFELGGFDESFRTHEDWDYWIRLLQNEGDVVCIQDVLFMYRKRSDGTSLIDQLEREPRRIQEDWQKIYDKHRSLYLQHNLGYYDLIVQLNKMEQSERMLSSHLKDVSEFKDALASQLNEANDSKCILEGQLNEVNNHKSLLEVQLTEISDSKSLIENQLESANQSAQILKVQLDEMIQLNEQLDQRYRKYKKLWTVRLMKPIIKTEQAISSANTLRKGFRRLIKEKGSIGKGYQHLRRLKKSQGTKAVKVLLRTIATTTSVSNVVDTATVGSGYRYVEPVCPRNIDDILLNMKNKPLFSIVVPIYNTPINLLDELIQSIKNQWYQNWELILVDDCSPNQDLRNKLYDITDSQIKVVFLEKNSGISEATNAGIDISRGEYIVFVDHDDLITVDCLYELALCIDQDDPDMIYSDEDKIDEHSRCYSQPHFKPDWSPDSLMSVPCIAHVVCVRKEILNYTGLLRSEVDGCQDWDLTIRIAEYTQNIKHIPKVLYHWRIIPQSIASNMEAKPYVLEASKKTRIDAFQRRGLNGVVEPIIGDKTQFRVNYLPRGNPLISIIIPTRDNARILKNCVYSILENTQYLFFEVIIIDNGSVESDTINYLKEISKHEKVQVVPCDIPFNFSKLSNLGAEQANGEVLLFLNDDTEVIQSDWLERMLGYAQLPHIGAVGAQLLYPKEKLIQHAGVINLLSGPAHAFARLDPSVTHYFYRTKLEYNWIAVTGACLMIEKKKFELIGRFDEGFPVAYNDVALCFSALQNGLYNIVCQSVNVYHYESISRGSDYTDEKKRKRLEKDLYNLYSKFPMYYKYDPFYNVNLHPTKTNFELNL